MGSSRISKTRFDPNKGKVKTCVYYDGCLSYINMTELINVKTTIANRTHKVIRSTKEAEWANPTRRCPILTSRPVLSDFCIKTKAINARQKHTRNRSTTIARIPIFMELILCMTSHNPDSDLIQAKTACSSNLLGIQGRIELLHHVGFIQYPFFDIVLGR